MPNLDEHVAILRCQTWNTWPSTSFVEYRKFQIDYGAPTPVPARIAVLFYEQRLDPKRYLNEETSIGPLLWDGDTPGFLRVRDTILKAPEDVVEVSWKYRNSRRGEVDICINFKFSGALPKPLVEALRTSASAILSLINLQLHDFLTPAAPFQVRKVLPDGGGQLESTHLLAVHNRQTLDQHALETTLAQIADALLRSSYGPKLQIALELYASHFTEEQAQVRFLLLVIAIESLASPTPKHQVVASLLLRWRGELEAEMKHYHPTSEEFQSLKALLRELSFRADDSIRNQVRRLFETLPELKPEEAHVLQRRALHIYDKRSTLVHQGHLPAEELVTLESEARKLLERVFVSAIENLTCE